jgi:H+-transporting ATPase
MYLKLSVAGHLTIFLTRTRGPFWSVRPAKILWIAVLGTQIVATLIAVYGLFMTPLGWGWAGFVWGYALLWFLVNDRIKLLAYRIFDPVKVETPTATNPEIKAKAQMEIKTEPQPDANDETKHDPKAEAKPEEKVAPAQEASSEAKPKIETKPDVNSTPETKAKTATDLTPQIAARAYELYEHQGHRDGQSAQNWDKAEQEIRATQAKAEPKATKPTAEAGSQPELEPDTKVEPKPATKVEPAPEVKVVPPATAKAEPKPDAKTDIKPTDKVEPKPDDKAETKSGPNVKPAIEVSPRLIKKVHEFFEQLGREDVRSVQELDEAKQKIPEAETKK